MPQPQLSFEVAGPREMIFFNPAKTTAGIVTCGGLCPGLNDIIRGIVTQLHLRYGVTKVYGFRYGYEGLIPRYGHTPMVLRPESVAQIHNFGGTILGTSRGPQDIGEMVDLLEEMSFDIFFVVGGDGTLRGAFELTKEIERRGLKKAVVGIPKTIDNDIMYLDKSFGFETAFGVAVQAVKCALHRGDRLGEWHRPGQAHGPRFRLHRLLRRARREQCRFRAHSRGCLRARWRARAARSAPLPAGEAEERRHRRLRRRRPADCLKPRTRPMPAATRSSATSACS